MYILETILQWLYELLIEMLKVLFALITIRIIRSGLNFACYMYKIVTWSDYYFLSNIT